MNKEKREFMKKMLNKAFKIEDFEEGGTTEVSIKDSFAAGEVISAVQGIYEIGIIDTDKYELNENIKLQN